MNDYDIIARENAVSAMRSNEPENDEDTNGDEELLTRKVETEEHQSIRLGLYMVLKETRGEPGLSIAEVASQIMGAFTREECHALVNQLNKNLDA